MPHTIKIVIIGIGAVGGYFGGVLAKKYAENNEVEIYFVARGEHLKQIQEKGLKIVNGENTFIAKPHLATEHAEEIGIADFIIVCTKSYDLEAAIMQLKPCIDKKTILIPLLNGVDSVERIKGMLPENQVLSACVYIISQLKEAGTIEVTGNVQSLFFGTDNAVNQEQRLLEKLLKEADIKATLTPNISTIVWEKFIFISSIATATSYFDCCVGKLLEEHEETLKKLIDEATDIALAKGIQLDAEIRIKTFNKQKSLPYDTITSMHRDFRKGGKTEYVSITEYVTNWGKRLNIKTAAFDKILKSFIECAS
ncbi:MAG: 2-dehydropantoate 2-reductase [Bacteroidota bacterium]|nr:2-dehydropantoate 2-reductase [Bacteroidota bacterium]